MKHMLKIATLAALLPGVAAAHGGPEGHAHPHGLEGLLLVAFVALTILALRQMRR
jgi:hypothetical protein